MSENELIVLGNVAVLALAVLACSILDSGWPLVMPLICGFSRRRGGK